MGYYSATKSTNKWGSAIPWQLAHKKEKRLYPHGQMVIARVRQRGISSAVPYYAGGTVVQAWKWETRWKRVLLVRPSPAANLLKKARMDPQSTCSKSMKRRRMAQCDVPGHCYCLPVALHYSSLAWGLHAFRVFNVAVAELGGRKRGEEGGRAEKGAE